ncbi:MAG: hypothetical protein VYD19_04510 [Myxococcota bacterium]|nr:hypothetical protein [Myxococcota bacterium]
MSALVLVILLFAQLKDKPDSSVGAVPQSTEQDRDGRTERPQKSGLGEGPSDRLTESKSTPSEEESETEVPLVWWVEGAGPLAPSALGDCLQRLGATLKVERGDRRGELKLLTPQGEPAQLIRREGGLSGASQLWISTAQGRGAWRQAATHLRSIRCISEGGGTLHDPLLGRSWGPSRWPQLGEEGALPISDLIQSQRRTGGGYESLGLRRLGLPELQLEGSSAEGRRALFEFAGALIMHPKRLGADAAQSLFKARGVNYRLAPAETSTAPRLILDEEGEPASRLKRPARSKRRVRPKRRSRSRRSRPKRRRRRRQASPRREERPPPPPAPPPTFRPRYR